MYKISLFLLFSLFISSNSKDLKGTFRAFLIKEENQLVRANFDLVFLSYNSYEKIVYEVNKQPEISEKIKGSIEKLNNKKGQDVYYLSDSTSIKKKLKIDSISLVMPRIIMEIKKVNSDTLKFRNTYSSQLNVTIEKGVLIKLK